MLPQPTIFTVETKTNDGSSCPPSNGLDLLFAAAEQRQQTTAAPPSGRAVSDCGSSISSLSEVDVVSHPSPTKIFFPEVLMDMLNNNQRYASIIAWVPDGNSFVIKSRHEFKEKVLPLYFKSNFDSFLRKLKRWGFEKDKVNRRGDPSIQFSHRYFRRDDSGLCLRMRCKSGPGSRADEGVNIQEDPQEVMAMRSSPPEHHDMMCQKGALVDHLMNQQAAQTRLLEEINQAAMAEKLAALAAARREHTYDQALAAERLRRMDQEQFLIKKRMLVAAKKAQLAQKLSEYMAVPHHTMNEAVQQDYRNLNQLQRLGHTMDMNSFSEESIGSFYRPMAGSLRTQQSREALRASILAKRQELGLPPFRQTPVCLPVAPSPSNLPQSLPRPFSSGSLK
jgi:hypothetical protein